MSPSLSPTYVCFIGPFLLSSLFISCVQEADNCKWRFAKQWRGLILMADACLIPCNAFRFQPPLHSQRLEKAAEFICELMHVCQAFLFSTVMWALCMVAQEGWAYQRGCSSSCSITAILFKVVWLGRGKAPISGLPGFRAGMVCTPRLCVSISAAVLPELNHGCY